jgi:hypothetical protein
MPDSLESFAPAPTNDATHHRGQGANPLEFLAPVVTHIPDKHQVMTRIIWLVRESTAGGATAGGGSDDRSGADRPAQRENLTLTVARRRWAELLRHMYEVDPHQCPACGGAMRIVAFLTERAVIDAILQHVRRTTPARGRGVPGPDVGSTPHAGSPRGRSGHAAVGARPRSPE